METSRKIFEKMLWKYEFLPADRTRNVFLNLNSSMGQLHNLYLNFIPLESSKRLIVPGYEWFVYMKVFQSLSLGNWEIPSD